MTTEIEQNKEAPAQEPDLNPETFLRLIKTVNYMKGIAERGRGYPCPDDVLPEKFLLEYVIELEGKEAAPSQEPVAWWITTDNRNIPDRHDGWLAFDIEEFKKNVAPNLTIVKWRPLVFGDIATPDAVRAENGEAEKKC